MRHIRKSSLSVIAVSVALATTACTGGGMPIASARASAFADVSTAVGAAVRAAGGGIEGSVTLTWWHNGTTDPLKTVWQQAAASYQADHRGVTVQPESIENEALATKVTIALQSGDPPDIYQQSGGSQEATQVKSGQVMDMTRQTSGWIGEIGPAVKNWQVDGKQYGVPYALHVVGFWYRKDLFARAGITSTPTTMGQLKSDVVKLKAAGIAPIAIGAKDIWPDAFYWGYFAVRECSVNTLQQAARTLRLTGPCWVKAGNDLGSFLAIHPFQNGFLGTPALAGAASSAGMLANGAAAMELQGDWEASALTPLTRDTAVSSKLGWFPFPAVAGGQGDPAALLGGGDGFSCTTHATSACPDFLEYLDGTDVQRKLAAAGVGLPVNPAAAPAVSDPTMQQMLRYTRSAPYLQQYFDIAFPTDAGQALDAAVGKFFVGQGTPQAIVSAVSEGR